MLESEQRIQEAIARKMENLKRIGRRRILLIDIIDKILETEERSVVKIRYDYYHRNNKIVRTRSSRLFMASVCSINIETNVL